MYKIQNLNKIDEEGLKVFPSDQYQIDPNFADPEAIIVRSFDMLNMEMPSSLKSIARAGAGYNNIPVEKCTEKGIVVFNTPGANANGVKELIIAAMLLTSRDVAGSIEWAKTLKDKGDEIPALVEKGKNNFAGTEIQGKTLAVIGLGAIGGLVANAAQALGMNVVGYDAFLSLKAALQLNNKVNVVASLESALAHADFITLHIPQNAETKGFINKERIAMMKDGVRILNFARGGLINAADLKEALESGKVGKYITDFPDAAVLGMKNAISIPHLGASTAESETNCAIMAAEQTREYLENGNIINSVNFPAAEMDRNGGTRIVIANKNVPNMVSQITTVLASENVNIANMLNRNRNEIAYNIIDIDRDDICDSCISKLKAIDGVFLIRVIK
ncbi:MAG TPA: 3-phosphoglycerate dehydrogenase family protein [Prolixibacteraceae bacterium]|nr:3-phosphoglycerate dehydrogenase family protein [Prolixibacteraceae bacterium]HPS14048.1 3-phosphoglycerate dehydrogenase family protein [Prolixibacteraceae bacterium]